jgi:hypothetical protein
VTRLERFRTGPAGWYTARALILGAALWIGGVGSLLIWDGFARTSLPFVDRIVDGGCGLTIVGIGVWFALQAVFP